MRIGLRVFRPGHQHLRLREDPLQFRDKRNGTALTLVDRLHAERLTHGGERILGRFGVRVHGPPHAVVQRGHGHTRTEWRVCGEEIGNRLLRLFRSLTGGGAHRQAESCLVGDDIERSVNRVRVESDDRGTRLGPQAGGKRTGAGEPVARHEGRVRTHLVGIEILLQAADRLLGEQAGDVELAVRIIHGRDKHGCERVRVENRPAVLPGVDGMVENFHTHVERGVAAQAGGQAGDVRGPVAGVRDDDDVGVEFVAVRFDEGDEAARAHFLFSFEEHFDIDVQVIAERMERARVDGDAAAVVAGAAPVKAVAHLGGGEGVVDTPVRRIRRGLHIVVRVQEHGGRFRVDDMRADDLPRARGAVRVGGLFDMRIDTDLAHFAGDEFSRTLHMLAGDALR